ncbi:hypothetical protein ACQ4PT_068268 [Festuca glaucescens]
MRLSEAEKKGVKVGGGLKGKAKAAEPQVVGKLMSEKLAAAEYLKRALGGIWCPMNGTTCKELGDNRFMFTFSQASGKSKALHEGPWMFNHELLVLVDYDPRKTLDEYQFNKVPCWIRVMQMPFGLMNRDTAEAIGAEFGGLLDAETEEDGTAAGKFLRIKVTLDIRVPLRHGIKLFVEEEEDAGEQGVDDEAVEAGDTVVDEDGNQKDYCQTRDRKSKKFEFGPELIARKSGEDRGRASPGGFGGNWGGAGSGSKSGSRSECASWRKDKEGSAQLIEQGKGDVDKVTSPMKRGTISSDLRGNASERDDTRVVQAPVKEKVAVEEMEVEVATKNLTEKGVPVVANAGTMVGAHAAGEEEENYQKQAKKIGTFKRIKRANTSKPEETKGKAGVKRALVVEETEEEEAGKKAKTQQEERKVESAFVPGRLIMDNILITYETTHFMHNRKGGRDGITAVKLDMSKAYDRVDWSFLEKMMIKMGFGSEWVKLVMSCVRTVSYRVKVNSELTSIIQPQRGLRHGCPLSSYLFLLCGEGLSALFQNADADGSLQGIQICMGAPRINHMFFADDALIFMKVNEANARKLQQILAAYEVELLESLAQLEDDIQMKALALMWDWWDARNKVNAGEYRRTTTEVCHRMERHLIDFQNLYKTEKKAKPPDSHKWRKPPDDFVKVNFDGAFDNATGKGA